MFSRGADKGPSQDHHGSGGISWCLRRANSTLLSSPLIAIVYVMPISRIILAVICLLLIGNRSHAHNMPQSAVMMDFGREDVTVDLILPIQELELAFKQPLLHEPAAILTKYERQLRAYLHEHIQPTTMDGKPWTVEVGKLDLQIRDLPYDLLARVTMTPPNGASVRKFRFNYSVTNHEVMSHIAIVTVRSDWDNAVFSGHPENLGMLQFMVTYLDIDRSKGSWTRGFATVFKRGMSHITGGGDHLMFLLALMLPAPLLVSGKRWGNHAGLKRTLLKLLKIISAFTIGHSLTLAVAGLGWVKVPGQPVEILIAVSILVSAIHAIRPIFAGKEIYIAGGFGLIHGLAFASSLTEFGFTTWYMALTVLAFNLGIEVMQLAVVVLAIPLLVYFSRTASYHRVRLVGAILCGTAAIWWIGDRAFSLSNAAGPLGDKLASHALWLIPSVIVLGLIANAARYRES